MQVNNIENLSFKKVSISPEFLLRYSNEQAKMFQQAYDTLGENPNKLYFHLDNNNKLVLTVYNTTKKLMGQFNEAVFGSAKETYKKAVECCQKLPCKYGKLPADFENFLARYCNSQWH